MQEKEQKKRLNNFIIYGLDEKGKTIDEIKENDAKIIANFISKVGIVCDPKSITRLGKSTENKKRTLKIVMSTNQQKVSVMTNLRKLKGTEDEFGKIRVTDNYTNEEREQIKTWVKRAEEKSSEDPLNVLESAVIQQAVYACCLSPG